MKAVWKKEIYQYATSMIGAVFLASYAGMVGYYFTVGNLLAADGSVAVLFHSIFSVLMVFIPMLTMRLFAEEKKLRTEQLIFTSPLSVFQIVMGKFLAAFCIFLVGSIPVILAVVILGYYGTFQLLETLGNWCGLCGAGAAFLAIGLFASSVTENQLVAAIMSYVIMLGLWMLDFLKYYVQNRWIAAAIEYLSFRAHFEELSAGIFSFSSIAYFISLTFLMLGWTQLILKSRRWK